MFDSLRIGNTAREAHKYTPVHPDPSIGTNHGISLLLYGKHSEQFRNASAALMREVNAGEKGKERTSEEAAAASARFVVTCCAGWEGATMPAPKTKAKKVKGEKNVYEGKFVPEPYDPAKLEAILKDDDFRWMRVGAERFLQDDRNFFPKLAPS